MLLFIYLTDTLTHHCALCNQWITVPGKMKQRYRLSHSATHEAFPRPSAELCSRFKTSKLLGNTVALSPKAPRQHPSKCTALWQLCVLHLRNHGYGLKSASEPSYRNMKMQR